MVHMTKYDRFLFATMLLLIGLGMLLVNLLPAETGTKVVIEARGEIIQTLELSKLQPGERIPIPGRLGNSILEVGENRVRLVDSPCPDRLCIGMGWIKSPGQVIVCLPNQVVVRMEEGGETELDGVAG